MSPGAKLRVRKPKRTAVFISGSGSTLQTLLEVRHQLCITVIISNKKLALGALKAKRFGCQIKFLRKEDSYQDLNIFLKNNNIEQIFLAGFMKILPAEFVAQWPEQIFNIHPSLLPEFPGLMASEKSFQAQADMGVTIHHVNQHMDEGPIFLQQKSVSQNVINQMNFAEAQFWLRRTEQHLLREFALRSAV